MATAVEAPKDAMVDGEATARISGRRLLELNFKTSDGKSFRLDGVDADTTIFGLKEMIAEKCGFAAVHQRLLCKGRLLGGDSDALQGAQIPANATLFVVKNAAWGAAKAQAPAGSVPCAGGCGQFATSRTDNYCSACFAKMPVQEERRALWQGMFLDQVDDEAGEEESGSVAGSVDSTDSADLVLGAAVEVRGLQGAKELNGRCGYIVNYVEESGRYSVKLKGEERAKGMRAMNLRRLEGIPTLPLSKFFKQKDRTKCWRCARKCGLAGFACPCGFVFCSRHRYSEDHDCDYDHKGKGRALLAKNNPKLMEYVGDLINER